MPPPKGKQPTKGVRQIVSENAATVSFYRNMSIAASAIYTLTTFFFYKEDFTNLYICLNVLVLCIYIASHHMLVHLSRPTYDETQQILNPGFDLNMEGAIGEHVKDVVILTSITHVMALISNYFWLLLFLIPIRVLYLLWVHLLSPWIFQEAPKETEQDEKKRKKMERRMKRMQ